LNLLNNAHDAIAHLSERWIRLDVVEKEGFYELSVEDSGFGILTIVAEKMMNPFFITKEVGKGTGLGLSIFAI
jgi:C4-dicarboxylate-specific signal transduction histidine kinase